MSIVENEFPGTPHKQTCMNHDREAKNAEEKSAAKEDCDDAKDGTKATSPSSRGDSSPSAEAKLRGRPLIQAVCAYYFDDEDFQEELEAWACQRDRSELFSPLDTEYSLAQSALFDEFKDLFEGRLERYLAKLSASSEELFSAIQQDESTDFYSGNTLVAVINASADFKHFHAMMCDARAGEFIWGIPPLQDEKTGELYC